MNSLIYKILILNSWTPSSGLHLLTILLTISRKKLGDFLTLFESLEILSILFALMIFSKNKKTKLDQRSSSFTLISDKIKSFSKLYILKIESYSQ